MQKQQSNTSDFIEDYATTPVPQNKTVGGFRIGMINGGLAFAVPGLITGIEIGNALGFEQSLYAFLLGGLILSILGVITGLVGKHNRLASCMMMKFVFGRQGANILSVTFVVALLGWYGVNIDLFSDATERLLLDVFDYHVSIYVLEIIIGFVVTLTTIWGFKLLEKISVLFVPLLFLVIAYMIFKSCTYSNSEQIDQHIESSLTFGMAVSAVVGSFIVSVVLMPDFTRFATDSKDTVIASFLPFLFLSSFVYCASAYAGLAVGNGDVLSVMLTLGLGSFAFLLLILSSWIANVINLYSAGLGITSLHTSLAEWKVILVAGILGTIAATFNLLDSFTDFLFGLSIVFTPVAAIYVTDFFILRKQKTYNVAELEEVEMININAMIAWGLSILITLMANNGLITITSIEVCDAVLVSFPVYYLLSMKFNKSSANSA